MMKVVLRTWSINIRSLCVTQCYYFGHLEISSSVILDGIHCCPCDTYGVPQSGPRWCCHCVSYRRRCRLRAVHWVFQDGLEGSWPKWGWSCSPTLYLLSRCHLSTIQISPKLFDLHIPLVFEVSQIYLWIGSGTIFLSYNRPCNGKHKVILIKPRHHIIHKPDPSNYP